MKKNNFWHKILFLKTNSTQSEIGGTSENIKKDCKLHIHQIWFFYHNLHDFTLNYAALKGLVGS